MSELIPLLLAFAIMAGAAVILSWQLIQVERRLGDAHRVIQELLARIQAHSPAEYQAWMNHPAPPMPDPGAWVFDETGLLKAPAERIEE